MNEEQKKNFTDALLYEHYDAANLIIRQALSDEHHDTVFALISSAEQALELMIRDANTAKLMLQNPRLRQLTGGIRHDSTPNLIGFYKLSERRPSFYADINQETGNADVFRETRELGRGAHAHVRLFSNAEGASFAVKTPHHEALGTSKESVVGAIMDYQQEHAIMRRAYKNPRTCKLFYAAEHHEHGKLNATLRSMMPHIRGVQVHTYLQRVQSTHELAHIILEMTASLMRLHQNNIIHGDITLNNIMISHGSDHKITFVDFGLSYLLTAPTALCFTPEERVDYLAPERFDYPYEPAPHTSQDVYSLAYTIDCYIIDTHPEGENLTRLYPSIDAFMQQGQNINPALRPSLASFHAALSDDIGWPYDDGITVPSTRI
ncbi:MAG: protein kinase [Legionellaceae bacterium]|nr:protein kinase [Legionellaceae bacterium]